MQNTKLIELLKSLNLSEIQDFRHFLYSPLHNKREKLRVLGDFILQYAPDYTHSKFTKAQAIRAVFGKKTASPQMLNNLLSELLQLVYAFLTYQELDKQHFLKQDLLLQNLLERNSTYHVEKKMAKLQQQVEKQTTRNAAYHQQEFLFFEKKDALFLRKTRRGSDDNLQQMSQHFDAYYLAQSLQIACKMASRNIVIQAQYDYTFFEKCFAFFEAEKGNSQSPYIQIYYNIFQLITKQGATYYNTLRKLLQQYAPILAPQELKDVYDYILNYCIRQINLGKTEFYQEVFEWYKILLDNEIVLDNQQLSEHKFRNIVTASLRSNAYDWAAIFIQTYQHFLPSNVRKNAVAYNLAALFFAQKEYSKALIQLFDVTFTDSFYHILSSIIQLKSYFHLQETEAFFALIHALRQYIQRNKELSTYHKETNLNFLRFAKQIYQWQLSAPVLPKHLWAKKQQTIQAALNTTNPITNKEWLMEVLKFR